MWAERRGRWWPAIVVRANADGTFRVHYEIDATASDEVIQSARVAPWHPTPPGPRGSEAMPFIFVITAALVLALVIGAVVVWRERGAVRVADLRELAPTTASE